MKILRQFFLTAISIGTIAAIFLVIDQPGEEQKTGKQLQRAEDFEARQRQEFMMLRDPVTNKIPKNIFFLEREFAKKMPQVQSSILYKGTSIQNAQALTWTERGPNNTSGRIRQIGIDTRSTSTSTAVIIAGAISGGLWKSTDGGGTWSKKTSSAMLHSVTCVVQDTRSGQNDVWYAGSGENLGNSASGEGATYVGDGVYKSTNNGDSWSLLANTQTADNNSWSSDWQYVWRIVIHPTSGNIYAATTGGVYRSTNGGTDWTKVLSSGNNNTLKTDLTMTSTGVIYAATNSGGGTMAGIRKCTDDGTTWTDASPTMPGTYGRTIITTAPSDPTVVYFFTEGVSGTNNTPAVSGHMLWRSTNSGGAWTNISTVIPATTSGGDPGLDAFSTQSGYDMLLHVKPDDAKFIIVGGVSMFKIPDVTNDNQTVQQKHIGGYGISAYGTANDLNDFKNHHPDNHYGVFLPGSNIIFYCANDGGVHLALDITAASSGTFWQSPKRTGLNITQLYGLSLDKSTTGSGFIAAGLQDRGNWMSRTTGATVSWQEVGGGDGAFSEISNNATGTNVYQSTTNGSIFRFLKSDANSPVTATTNMKPTTVTNPLFINPFVLDPSTSSDIIYFAGGNTTGSKNTGVWRTTDATTTTTSTGWSYFVNSDVASEQVSALAVSKTNSANVLYYGTSGGKVYRIDNANTADVATTTPTVITGGSFPSGYVSSIAIDPTNSANVLVTFSNYSVAKLWYSTNSGTSWTNISGNLTGTNSPSIRHSEIFTIASTLHLLLAASTGVYYTTNINGGSTVWTQEGQSTIGNVVCMMLDYRASDRTLVVATHGRGVFETQLPDAVLPVELVAFGGSPGRNKVDLFWTTATEINSYGFDVEQSGNGLEWMRIGFVSGSGTSNAPNSYTFTDNVPVNGINHYRLKMIDRDGSFEYSNATEVSFASPSKFALAQNYPNPFNPMTSIKFSVPVSGRVSLKIYDIQGKEVAELVNGHKTAGTYDVQFNATSYASGIYLYKLVTEKFSETKKMILIK